MLLDLGMWQILKLLFILKKLKTIRKKIQDCPLIPSKKFNALINIIIQKIENGIENISKKILFLKNVMEIFSIIKFSLISIPSNNIIIK